MCAGRPYGSTTFRWTPGTVSLDCRAAIWLLPGFRRITVAVSDGSFVDEFMLDTGSSVSSVSMSSPLARSVRFCKTPALATVLGPPLHPGGRDAPATRVHAIEFGVVPRLAMGPVEGRDVCLGGSSVRGSRANPANILGLNVLQATALVRSADGWSLETGPRSPWPGASVARLERPGLPIVTIVDVNGSPVHALIDTGAPKSIAFRAAGTAPWRLIASDGRTVLTASRANAEGDPGDAPIAFGGIPVDFVIGLDVLDRGTWRIDFERSTWEFR
jgi:hypothetical protein